MHHAIRTALVCSVISLASSASSQEKLAVVATFSIIGDLAQNLGGDQIELRTLVGPNSDAHVYQPTPADAKALAHADVVLANGLQLEGFLTRLIDASGTTAPIVEVSKGARVIEDPLGGHFHFVDDQAVFHAAPKDPHAWQSVANAKVYVDNIVDAFCAVDVTGCPDYRANAAAYHDQLTALDREIRDVIASIPEDKRVVVVAHNAFRYFGDAYGLQFLSPVGMSTDADASAADVAGIITEIRARHASAIFAENISDPRLVEQMASEAGLTVGGVLYSDALSGPDGPAPTYVEMMRSNARTITEAISAQ